MKALLSTAITMLICAVTTATTKVTTTIDFGRNSRNCAGRGICTTTTTVENGMVHATFELSSDGTSLNCTIPQAEFDNNANAGQISNEQFIQEEVYIFPASIAQKLGTDDRLTIPAGQYPVTQSKGVYHINFLIAGHTTGTQ